MAVHAPAAQAFSQRFAEAGVGRGNERLGRKPGREYPHSTAGCGGTAKGSSNQKVEPAPAVLWTPMRPPISSTIFREMARPRPVPPNFRDDEVSACTNGWNSFLDLVRRQADAGVGDFKAQVDAAGGMELHLHADDDFALFGEFDAVTDEVEQHLPEPGGVADQPVRNVAADDGGEGSFLPGTRVAAFSSTPSTMARREKSSCAMVILPASILEKSSTSLMTWSRALALSTAASANSRWRGSRRVCASNSTMPRMPLNGVRISWLMLARNSLLALLARLACSAAAWASVAAAWSCGSFSPAWPWLPWRPFPRFCAG